MPYAVLPEGFPEPPPLSKHYLAAQDWTFTHFQELIAEYPDQWVAVSEREVVAHGTDLGEVRRVAREKTGWKDCYTMLVERTPRFYTS